LKIGDMRASAVADMTYRELGPEDSGIAHNLGVGAGSPKMTVR